MPNNIQGTFGVVQKKHIKVMGQPCQSPDFNNVMLNIYMGS